jgi:bifunctional DNA-binding transcriptional regulator/antitoxin component of YhaV-PrlF toxin-antitoxin module
MSEDSKKIRMRISKGYRVVLPSELRERYKVNVGDEVVWEISKSSVLVQLQKKPSLNSIAAIGRSGKKSNSVELKKRIQKGEI